ncbi:hypothetical protein JCM6882_003177 [Rhodosporidiobolus microsporus]
MSFVLPNVSATELARRESHNAFASTSQAAGSGAGLSSATGMGTSGDAGRRAGVSKGRRKGKGKGRMMMIKIFYALNSPRFGGASTPSSGGPASAPTPDFLAVLDPSLAPSPQPPIPSSSSNGASEINYSCMARLSAPVWVQVINGRKGADGEERQQFGRVTLKTCLSAICISRPELVIDSTKDFSVSAVDPYESSHQRQPPPGAASTGSSSRPGDGFVEGKGMLSWTLAEKKEGTTMVCGKIAGSEMGDGRRSKRRKGEDGGVIGGEDEDDEDESADETEETLEVWLQLNERDAFTQGQFLDCLRSYHNPVQQLQSEISDFNSSPPKQRDSLPIPPSSSLGAFPSMSTGDPVKRKRPRESHPPLPVPPPAAAAPAPTAPPAPFVAASSPAFPTAALPVEPATLQDPRVLALLGQLIPSLAAANAPAPPAPAPAPAPALSLDSPQGQALLPAIRTLAQFYGLQLPNPPASAAAPAPAPAPAAVAAAVPLPPSSMLPSSTAPGPSSHPPQASARPPTGKATRKNREHFASIDVNTLAGPPVGKQNPRAPEEGCSNCKRKKSTVWREGLGEDRSSTATVCNACGIFYNKNGYHRSKGNADAQPSAVRANSGGSTASSAPKGGRPLQGRLTATCEADLKKQQTKRKPSSPSDRHQPGIIPPLSPSKHIGPRSPSLKFDFAHSSNRHSNGSSSNRHSLGAGAGFMSSPGRSPRMRYRQTSNPFAATSPVRGSSSNNHGLGVSYESDGEERGPNPFGGNLFGGGPGSPSPARVVDHSRGQQQQQQQGGSGGKGMPSYLLTASPGTALDRILNETNVGAFSGMFGSGGAGGGTSTSAGGGGEGMQVEQQQQQHGAPADGGFADFDFFLAPGSPTRGKENARPSKVEHATSATAEPATDIDSFESVLSSLRRDFSTRLSSNALTAPSSPAPSSPCILPRTSTATPGSKGRAPASSGRAPPSIVDSFLDGVVPAFALNAGKAGDGKGTTPASDSDAWSPANGGEDQTLTLDSAAMGANGAKDGQGQATSGFDFSHLHPSGNGSGSGSGSNNTRSSRRAAFIPAHLIAPSDATDFDFGSLPPSSPPQLPSEAFPTPSDFDGITPSADGGDGDDRAAQQQQQHHHHHGSHSHHPSPLTIEAVAEKVATEPNEDARKAMMALLQSLGASPEATRNGSGAVAAGGAVPLANGEGGKIELDRSTVNRLLSLISANTAQPAVSATATTTTTTSSPPSSAPFLTGSAASIAPAAAQASAATFAAPPEQDDMSAFSLFQSFEQATGPDASGDLYANLFGGF